MFVVIRKALLAFMRPLKPVRSLLSTCPFVDANTACVLFNIGMGMYLESSYTTGKVVVVDEAHKVCLPVCLSLLSSSRAFATRSQYMTDTPASKALTESLLTVIRQQRHYGASVIISTQELYLLESEFSPSSLFNTTI